jgi:5'-methylthioinosine phosphorylase
MPKTYGLLIGSGWETLVGDDRGSTVETAYGAPSARVHRLAIGGQCAMSLARHGDRHTIPPHTINYRANVLALRTLGADAIIGLNTVGVITDIAKAGTIAIPDQLIDYTWGREHTLFEGHRKGVRHIDFTTPFADNLRQDLLAAAERAGVACHDGGVYAATQGPRLETAAEVNRLQRDGADFVGMTAMPEAAIAREAGIDYACIALVVNPAAGRGDAPIHDSVEKFTLSARNATMSTLEAFFAALS